MPAAWHAKDGLTRATAPNCNQGIKMTFKLQLTTAIVFTFVASVVMAATPLVFLVTGDTATGRPTVEGTTNLPDGAELTVTVSRKTSGYRAQDQFKVQGGKFKSAQFTAHGAPLLPGRYVLEVTGPISAVQSVARALGDNYSNFSGPLLKRGKYGTTLHYEMALVIPGQSSSAADTAARKVAAEERVAWLRKSCTEIPGIAERMTGKPMSRTDREASVRKCLVDTK